MPPLFAEEADSTAEAPRFRARAGEFQMVSTDDGFLVIPISSDGPTLQAQVVAFHLETPRPAAWAPAEQKGLFHWCTYLHPAPEPSSIGESVAATGVAVLPNNNVVVTGLSESQYFPVTVSGFGGGVPFYRDAFLAVLSNTGNNLLGSQMFGGSWYPDVDEAYAVAVSPSGTAAYVLGATDGLSFPTTTGVKQPTSGGNEDLFVATFLMP